MRDLARKLFLPALAVATLAACDGGGSGTGAGTPRLTVRLTDAPGDLKEAWIKVEKVHLQGTTASDSTSGRVTLMETPTGWVNLLTLSGGNFASLANGVAVPAGTYSELRLVVCDAYVVTRTGAVYATPGTALPAGVTATGTLRAPSACQSGFKVKLPGNSLTLESESTILSVDFDVSQSFGHQAGNSGAWVLHPVMSATAVGFSGTINGTVTVAAGVTLPACGGAAVDVTKFVPRAVTGADSVSAAVSAGGQYAMAVAPGTYTMAYAPVLSFTNGDSLSVTAAATPPTVTIAAGGTQTANYSITAATCKVKA
ncbi:MAG TPA: DUF4382 domain-containing protein [Longimicrobium sp.]|nr:DUF4382 domain-containing protein [Longimicrobium sp.]